MPVTTSTTLPAPVQQTFNMKLLSVPTPQFIHTLPAMEERMPRHGGRFMRFRRYQRLNPFLVPLGNSGIDPASQSLTSVDIDAQIDWYGTFVEINEQVVLQNQESVLNQAAERLGVAMRETEDNLARNMLASTASVINAIGGANGDVPTEISILDIRRTVRSLRSGDAKMFTNVIPGKDKIGTGPVRNGFLGLISSDLSVDLDSVPNFMPTSAYPSQEYVMPQEWGQVENVRFFDSSIGSISPNASNAGNDVYNCFIVGQESYAIIKQEGATSQFIYRPAVYSGALAQNVTVGVKFAQVPRLLNDAWVFNLRVTRAN